MELGTLLDKFNDEAFAQETMLRIGELGLIAKVNQVAAERGLAFGEVITHAVHSFTGHADSDHWMQLMSAINRTDDPGAAALKQMLEVALHRS